MAALIVKRRTTGSFLTCVVILVLTLSVNALLSGCMTTLGYVPEYIKPRNMSDKKTLIPTYRLIVRHIFLTGHGGHEVLFCLRDRLSANVFGTNHRVHSSDDRPRAGNIAGGVVAPRLWKTELA